MEARQAGYRKLTGAIVAIGTVPVNLSSCQRPPGTRRSHKATSPWKRSIYGMASGMRPGLELWGPQMNND